MQPGLYLKAFFKKNGEALASGVHWRVYQGDVATTQAPPVREVITDKLRAFLADLPSGNYLLRGSYQGLVVDKKISIIAGRVHEQSLVFDGGKLSLSTRTTVDGPMVSRIFYEIYSLAENAGKKPLKQFSSHQKQIYLPAGDYRVTAKIRNVVLEKKVKMTPVWAYSRGLSCQWGAC